VNGAWPDGAGELGLEPPQLTSSLIARLELEPGGVIMARLAPQLESGAALELAPYAVMAATSFEWRCRATFPPDVLRTLPCEPLPAP
jgi:hypothetical protein